MKRVLPLALALLLAFTTFIPLPAATASEHLSALNGKIEVVFTINSRVFTVTRYGIPSPTTTYHIIDVAPCVKNGRIYVPARHVAQAIGTLPEDISFCNGTVIFTDRTWYRPPTIVMTVGSRTLIRNNETFTMDAAPFIRNGRLMVPLYWLARAFYTSVTWDPISRSARIIREDRPAVQQKMGFAPPALTRGLRMPVLLALYPTPPLYGGNEGATIACWDPGPA